MGSLWVDKHRPKHLGQLDYHKKQATHLKKLVSQKPFEVISLERNKNCMH